MTQKHIILNKDVAIIIPLYKEHINADELISLKLLEKHLAKFDKYFVAPNNLVGGEIKRKGYKTVRFDKSNFESRHSYNKLLLRENFYEKFSMYKYILIYQLDALVFSDRLLFWCNQNYDYVSAPWFNSKIGFLTKKKGFPISGGNGGFSLRNVRSCINVLKKTDALTKRGTQRQIITLIWFCIAVLTGKSHKLWLNAPADNYPFNEDGFWSLEAPKYLSSYKVAPLKEAVKFAFETFPRKCFKMNGNRLPFGCHAWAKYDRNFWVPYLKV